MSKVQIKPFQWKDGKRLVDEVGNDRRAYSFGEGDTGVEVMFTWNGRTMRCIVGRHGHRVFRHFNQGTLKMDFEGIEKMPTKPTFDMPKEVIDDYLDLRAYEERVSRAYILSAANAGRRLIEAEKSDG